MNLIVYVLIILILFVLIYLYYLLQKPRKTSIEDIYGKYLISATNPDVAFTYRKRSDGKYENYYMNFEPEGGLLKLVISDHPVTGTGEDYILNKHGEIRENENGYTIEGVVVDFKCPSNWTWSVSDKTCKLKPLCTTDDVGKIKGIDYYHYKQLQQPRTARHSAYHNRLYALCQENESFELNVCPENMLYNQLEIQDATALPCVLYDVCSDMRKYEIHKLQIDPSVELGLQDYYICIDGKSVLKTCSDDQVFNMDIGGCIPINICSGKPDGLTFIIEGDDYNYTVCNGEQDYKIYCPFGLYTVDGLDHISCKIDNTERYFKYFSNDIITIPTGLYIYKDNKREAVYAKEELVRKTMELNPNTGRSFFTAVRNRRLYSPVEYQLYFLEYTDLTLENYEEKAIDSTNYMQFNPKYAVSACYFDNQLSTFNWNIFTDMPIVVDPDHVYYKYDTKIKHMTDNTTDLPSVDYFYFNTAKTIYKPKDPASVVVDEASGILCYANYELDRPPTMSDDKDLSKLLHILRLKQMVDGVYIMYFINPFDKELVAIAFSDRVIITEAFTLETDNTCTPLLYNSSLEAPDDTKLYLQLSSIRWDGVVLSNLEHYVLPNILMIVAFIDNDIFNKEFTIVKSEKLNKRSNLEDFSSTVESEYTPITSHTGDFSYFTNLLESISTEYLQADV